ncbi:hypothetical protein [Vibrio superstes]|uniref:Uncharacterized protein n=1 Tax=Vibrio superstes NBRC 103154 TaxID=1219062 RepID=A0A511QP62_9VIBR|nr:hypothetical protein [Vibrio superstes]GEM79128.1 hypothetical protein VSU01S_13730 [Vibrio superstes NBRC 103154]
MAYASKRFLLLNQTQQEEAKKRQSFIEKYLSDTDPGLFLEQASWDEFCHVHCDSMQIEKPEREEFARWCFELKMWQGDLFVLAPKPPTNQEYPSMRRIQP